MLVVFKREFLAYFYTPIAAVFIAAFYLLSGFFFFNYNLYGNSNDMRSLFSVLFTIVLFLIPLLTMRLMSEDKKLKTDQLLLMCPQSAAGIIIGKYLAALCVYLLGLSNIFIEAIILARSGPIEWPVIFGNFTGLFLLGSALIAIGLFISSLTESQAIAAIVTYCVSLLLMLLDSITVIVSGNALNNLMKALSMRTRYEYFTLGIMGIDHVIYFASVSFFFVFLAINSFEKQRWA